MSFYASYPFAGGSGGVPTYANLAAFPSASGAGNGALAIALDTDILYISNGTVWEVLADPTISPNAITALTGDGTATGPGSVPLTLATVNSGPGSYGSGTQIPVITVNGKGLVTSSSQVAITKGNLTDVGTDGITITNGTGAVLGSGTSIAQQKADSTHNGYLSSTDWNTFNNKQSALTFGNLTGTGMVITNGTGAVIGTGTTVAMPVQHDIWVDRNGDDTNGNGTLAAPFQTVGKALTLVSSPSSTNNYTIHLMSGRHDQETGDLLLPPYTFIVGDGGPDVGSYLRLPAGKAIKLGSGYASANGRGGIQSVYLGGGTSVNLDFIGIGGSFGSNFMLDDVFVTGTLTHTGRGVNGGDFIYIQNTLIFSTATFTGSEIQSFNSTYASSVSMTNGTAIPSDATFLGGSISGAFSATNTGGTTVTLTSTGTAYFSTFTTTGTISLTVDDNLPPGFSLSGGTTRTNTKNAFSQSYTPTTSGDWNSTPAAVGTGLDTLATSGIVKSQTANKVLASPNGSSGVPSFRSLVAGDLPNTGTAGTYVKVTTNAQGLVTSGSASPQAIADGGTGQTTKSAAFDALSPMTTAGDIIYGGASGTGTRLAAGTSTQVLHGGTTPSWSAVSLSADVTGTLPIGNGGTGQTTKGAAFDALSPLTTKGDLIAYSTTNTRVAVGTDGQVLTADSGSTPGVKWANPGALTATTGADADTTLTSNSASIQVVTPTANRIYTLPTTSVVQGQTFYIINASTSTFTITIKSSNGDVVRTVYPNTQGTVTALVATPTTGANWMGLEVVTSNSVSYTPTFTGLGTVSNASAYWKRRGEFVYVNGSVTAGTAAASLFSISLPGSLTLDSAKLTLSNTTSNPGNIVGQYTENGTGSSFGNILTATGTSTSVLYIGSNGPTITNPLIAQNGNAVLASNQVISYYFTVPISGWSENKG